MAAYPELFVLAILVYMAPTMVAAARGHRQRSAIAALNIFLGWTLIGWVSALTWAFTTDVRQS
jgi:hypothetical protein